MSRSIWVKVHAWCGTSSGWPRRTLPPSSSSTRSTPSPQSDLTLRPEVQADCLSSCCCCCLFLVKSSGGVNYLQFGVFSAADREVQRILLELLNQMDGFDQNVNVKVSPPASLRSRVTAPLQCEPTVIHSLCHSAEGASSCLVLPLTLNLGLGAVCTAADLHKENSQHALGFTKLKPFRL